MRSRALGASACVRLVLNFITFHHTSYLGPSLLFYFAPASLPPPFSKHPITPSDKRSSPTVHILLSFLREFPASFLSSFPAIFPCARVQAHRLSALMIAAASGKRDSIVQILGQIKPTEVNMSSASGCTALMIAADEGDVEIVKSLLAAGSEDKADNKGRTAMMLAAVAGHGEVVEVLLSAEARSSITHVDEDGRTAFMHACRANR
eukprot:1863905-Pleurochrysis_carterae.AAC.2